MLGNKVLVSISLMRPEKDISHSHVHAVRTTRKSWVFFHARKYSPVGLCAPVGPFLKEEGECFSVMGSLKTS